MGPVSAGESEGGYREYAAAKARLLRSLRGTVLEIGAGDGRNAGSMPIGVSWVGLEPDRGRVAKLSRLARARGVGFAPVRASADRIPLREGSVDAVLSVVTLCSVPDQGRALAEARRVLRPGGRLVFAEHVGARPGTWSRRAQRLAAPWSRRFDHGCDPLRDTEAAIRDSGLELAELGRYQLKQPFGVRVPYVVGVATR